MTSRLYAVILVVVSSALGACGLLGTAPGTSVVQFYNNSDRNVLVEDNELRPGQQGTFRYPSDGGKALIVFWGGCVHTYIAPVRKPGEYRGTDWMLRGAYRAQLNSDGKLYLVPPNATLPADAATMEQPEGFPLLPREGSSCLP